MQNGLDADKINKLLSHGRQVRSARIHNEISESNS